VAGEQAGVFGPQHHRPGAAGLEFRHLLGAAVAERKRIGAGLFQAAQGGYDKGAIAVDAAFGDARDALEADAFFSCAPARMRRAHSRVR